MNIKCVLLFALFLILPANANAQNQDHLKLHEFNGTSVDERFGISVDATGDINRDGYGDIIVGSRWNDHNGQNSGSAVIYSGRDGTVLHQFYGYAAGDEFGLSVSSAGDVNVDGYPDIIIGSPQFNIGSNPGPGKAYVYSGFDWSLLYTFTGEANFNGFGVSVHGAGDVNHDGYKDLIVGAHLNSRNGQYAGAAYVFSGLNGSRLYSIYGQNTNDWFGYHVNSSGDIDQDGFDDFLVGAIFEDHLFGLVNAGGVYLYSGRTGNQIFHWQGITPYGYLGIFSASAGDYNRDGYADIISGAVEADTPTGMIRGGIVQITSGLDGSYLNWFYGNSNLELFGSAVGNIGDVNADGYVDLLVSAIGDDNNGPDTGSIKIISGRTGQEMFTYNGAGTNDYFGLDVRAGDVNNDGVMDIIAGAMSNDSLATNAGSAYVFSPPKLFEASFDPNPTISFSAGGTVNFEINFGQRQAGKNYLMATSLSGTSPGIPVGNNLVVPLQHDALVDWTVAHPNAAPLLNTAGVLDQNGHGTFSVVLPPNSGPYPQVTLTFAGVAYDQNGISAVTTPIDLRVAP